LTEFTGGITNNGTVSAVGGSHNIFVGFMSIFSGGIVNAAGGVVGGAVGPALRPAMLQYSTAASPTGGRSVPAEMEAALMCNLLGHSQEPSATRA
jgi:hypothetical protein